MGSKEHSKNHSHCSTKRSQLKTAQSSEMKKSQVKKASVLPLSFEEKTKIGTKKNKVKSKFASNVAKIHFR